MYFGLVADDIHDWQRAEQLAQSGSRADFLKFYVHACVIFVFLRDHYEFFVFKVFPSWCFSSIGCNGSSVLG